jgi:hypothetical protein
MKLYYIRISLSLVLVSLGMAGCLKDKDYDDGKIQSTKPGGNQSIIEMKISATNTKNFVSLAYNNSNNDTTVNLVPITLASGTAPEDLHVTLDLKPELVKIYNDSNDTEFDVPTTSLVTIVSNVVTIPKGANTGYLQVKFKPSNLIGLELAYGFAISSVDKPNYIISGNLGSGVVAILIKNKFDGIYEVTGHLEDAINPSLNSTSDGPYPFNVEMRTTGANSLAMYSPDAGAYGHLIFGSYYGSFSPNITIDPTTNKITSVVNYFGQPSSNGRSADQLTGANINNVYNATDKSIYVSFVMIQGGGVRTTFTDTLTYKGPR